MAPCGLGGRSLGSTRTELTAGAARVFLTLDELAELLRLPEGHRLHAVDELPAGYCPGIALTIINDDGARPHLGRYTATEPLRVMDLTSYRKWVGDTALVVRSTLRAVEEPILPPHPAETGCADDCIHPSHRHHERAYRPGRRADDPGYAPARPPMAGSDPDRWPAFPGQHLPITGEPVRGDPGDEDQHMEGPR